MYKRGQENPTKASSKMHFEYISSYSCYSIYEKKMCWPITTFLRLIQLKQNFANSHEAKIF